LSLYVNVKDFQTQLQYVIHRYHHISKEVVELFTIPNNLAFENQFKFQPDARKLYQEYQTMLSSAAPNEKGFPYNVQQQLFEEFTKFKIIE